ncbi:FAD-dependent monooxygenase [Acetobacter fallax]|nr:FAD-dependent monooxygenase [Acetobacter fallax]
MPNSLPDSLDVIIAGAGPAGHFAGIPFFHDQIDTTRWPYRLSGSMGSLPTDMAALEAVLTQRATAMGITIRRGCAVGDFEQSGTEIRVRTETGTYRGRWLVGCDGGRSTVRKNAGIRFGGTEPEFTGYSAQAELADPARLKPGRHYTPAGMYTYAPSGMIAMVDFDDGAFHRTQPIDRTHIEAVLRRLSGIDVTITGLTHATTWTDRACQAIDYRKGRVLLAGDAAHVHAPLGDQGLNPGLGDAMNLGWKLAATIRGTAPTGLLDSYAQERYPAGEQILDWSRAQVALMRPTRSTRALQAIIRDLIGTRDDATCFAGRVWGIDLRYDFQGTHPLAGRSVPDFELADGTRLNEHLRSGRGLLLDAACCASRRSAAERCCGQIDYVAGALKDFPDLNGVLVRPDGVIAWASDDIPNDNEDLT